MLKPQILFNKIFPDLVIAVIFFLLIAVFCAWKFSVFPLDTNNFLKLMSLGTASCVLLLAVAVLINFHGSHFIAKVLSLVVLLLTVIRFWELTRDNHYLDWLFIPLTGFSLDHRDGAMSSLTSACLCLLSLSTFFSADVKSQQGHWKNWISLTLIFYVIFLVTIALSGYFLNLMLAYTWMGMRMSPHTATVLLMLSTLVFMLNYKLALQVIYKTSVKQRFLFGGGAVFLFGTMIFIILQQQINYVDNINQRAIVNLAKMENPNFSDLQNLIKTEYEVKQLILVLIGGFALVCVLLFSGIFFSLTHQLKQLSRLLLDSTRLNFPGSTKIPYLGDATEFGVIADTINSFMDLNRSQMRLQIRLQRIIESIPNGLMIINQQGVIDLVNDQLCMIFEYDRNELLGKELTLLVPTALQYPALQTSYFQQSEERLISSKFELTGITKNGRQIILEMGASSIESEQGMQVLISVIDISEKKTTEKNLAISREKFDLASKKIQQLDSLRASIVEYSEDAIISKTLTGHITSWNKAAEKMFGYSEQEVLDRNVKGLIVIPDKLQEYEELFQRVVKGEVIINHQLKALCKDGRQIDVSVSFSPIRDEQGNIVSISSIKRDISKTIKSANQLLAHQKELERSNKSLETFAYVASHDLKAPLRGISQLTSWLEEDIRDNKFESVSETSQKIKIRIKRMETLLDDLLAYYRVEKMQGFYKSLDVRQSVIDIFHMNNNKPGLVLEIENELPVFVTYVTPIEQVFSNLISNAIKHHDKSNGVIRIAAKDVNSDWYEFSVFDDGPGIDPQFHQRIFNMFQTLRPRDEVEGSGMGLALVKKIIEQYGGQVNIDSESRGSRFYFTWPKSIKRIET